LQEQPFQILVLLLERPGQVVTREEIRQKLWSNDTFVEFDDALNTAVRKLRAALNDSADNPRFLETVPRKGYRFVAPISLPPELQVEPSPVQNKIPDTVSVASKDCLLECKPIVVVWLAKLVMDRHCSVGARSPSRVLSISEPQ